jgi:ER membrane protein complex subunit 1
VLYKYINPNIVSFVTRTEDSIHVYLIDGVSGALRYKASHKTNLSAGKEDSIHIIRYENVIAYTYWKNTVDDPSVKSLITKQTELVVLEMFESKHADARMEGYIYLNEDLTCHLMTLPPFQS